MEQIPEKSNPPNPSLLRSPVPALSLLFALFVSFGYALAMTLTSFSSPNSMKQTPTSTAAVLTPPGAGAVAVIDVSLQHADDVATIFQAFTAANRNLADTSVGRIVFGRWDGEDLVVVRTTETRWEIQCHGGRVAIDRVLAQLEKSGVVIDRPPHHEIMNDVDPVAEQIRQTLLRCRTRKTAGLVLAQFDGRIHRLYNAACSEVEAERKAAEQHIERWKNVAEHLIRPWRVAIAGPPNAGKSSLINALAGLDRSIVSSIPGTTRDLVEVEIVIDGWMFQLVDTAGVRDVADSSLELAGIEQSLISLQECDLVCIVIDISDQQLQPSLLQALQFLTVPKAILYNKCDLIPLSGAQLQKADQTHDLTIGQRSDAVFSVSAVTGAGLPEFLQWMVRALIPDEPTAETTLPLVL
jgi:tRNA modification GTPase